MEILKDTPPMSEARQMSYFFGKDQQELAEAEYEVYRLGQLRAMGQATTEEVEAAKKRVIAVQIAEMDAEFDE
ncbi:MAG: hypothetical protein M2R45_03321 [Verrucomicrobia subdivision 3 bacterium]|nr:hypothetical protein [Limisphaerales bacterium]MCS1415399.1 hypothetical protein [Limisphaerales bacterium]